MNSLIKSLLCGFSVILAGFFIEQMYIPTYLVVAFVAIFNFTVGMWSE